MYFKAGEHKQAGLTYSPLKALISPRPIGWISTCDDKGNANLAPYSFFNAVSELPPMVMFVSAPDLREQAKGQHHSPKDSLANIKQTGEFGVNIVAHAQRDAMIETSATLPADVDEFAAAGLLMKKAHDISAPLVAGAPAQLECRLHDMITLPGTETKAGSIMVIGHIVSLHIADEFIIDGKIDVTRYQPIARLGYKDYATIEEIYEITQGLK